MGCVRVEYRIGRWQKLNKNLFYIIYMGMYRSVVAHGATDRSTTDAIDRGRK